MSNGIEFANSIGSNFWMITTVNGNYMYSEQISTHDVRMAFPPGHFYSPIPDLSQVRADADEIFDLRRSVHGIDLNTAEQMELLNVLVRYYQEQPFSSKKQTEMRFYFDNPFYSYSDSIFLYCMLRHLSPRRIIEVGSGYSTCCMLDTLQLQDASDTSITCIEPFPDRLLDLLQPADLERIKLVRSRVQDVDLECFGELRENDIL